MKPTDLVAHPEGGRFREVFRSATGVRLPDGRPRAALTHIYFELAAGERSRFHRVASDEVWNLYDGAGARLFLWREGSATVEEVELSRASVAFCHVVAAGTWQAAVPVDGRVLVGCSVAPGFEFADFELLGPDDDRARRLLALRPDLAQLLGAAQRGA